MELPERCRENLYAMTEHADIPALRACAAAMTETYQTKSGNGKALVRTEREVLAYAAVRMPATFGAVSEALARTLDGLPSGADTEIGTVLDLGAGTGAASWAAAERIPGAKITSVEREPEMLRAGKALFAGTDTDITWLCADAVETAHRFAGEKKTFGLVIASYMTNEMTREMRERFLPLLWQITGRVLLLVEPGTKIGYGILRDYRQTLLTMGAQIAAPCPGNGTCPLSADDWCHFSVRIARSRLHKLLKGGEVPYEDEKFSYLGAVKGTALPCGARVLRHPVKESGRITLSLCTPAGNVVRAVTKREKEGFRTARKAAWGDGLPRNAAFRDGGTDPKDG